MTQPEHNPFGFIGLTYDDVLLLPGHTDVIPSEADTSSRISKRISVQTPLLSAAMDESPLLRSVDLYLFRRGPGHFFERNGLGVGRQTVMFRAVQ